MNTVFLNEESCPYSKRLGKILKKPSVLRALDNVEIHQAGRNQQLETLYNVHYTPTLVSSDGKKHEGTEAFLWLERELERKKLNVKEAMDPHHSEYHSGNRRFVIAVAILIAAVYYSCKTKG